MNKLLLIFLFISQFTFSQVIVHSKNDPRLLAYKDSMECYICGLKQLNIAMRIKDREDIEEGRIAMNKIEKMIARLNPKIKFISCNKQFQFLYKYDGKYTITYWMPDIYKKPVCKVIYEPEEHIINNALKKDTTTIKTDSIKKPTVKNVFIYTLNGQTVSKEQFEKVYRNR